ncbi:hypothetical protein FWG95_02620 [Candidatus Saccharibacteria bacterium]|nr:hypothetical protein [Candidatus Saccharibacteria bacterium]
MIKRRRLIFGIMTAILVQAAAVTLLSIPALAVDYNQLKNGKQTAIDADIYCKSRWDSNAALPLRTRVNESAYFDDFWISSSAAGNQTTIDIPAGSSAPISLRFNILQGLCRTVTGSATSDANVINSRVSDTSGADATPAPLTGSAANRPDKVRFAYTVWGLSDGGKGGSFSGFSPGAPLLAARNDSTRFWLDTMNFTYWPPPGGFNETTTVYITATFSSVSQFYLYPATYMEMACLPGLFKWNNTGNGGWPRPPDNEITRGNAHLYLKECGRGSTTEPIKFNVPQNYLLFPRATVDPPNEVQSGDQASFRTYVDNTGPTVANNISWAVRSFVLPAGNDGLYNAYTAKPVALGTAYETIFPGATNVQVQRPSSAGTSNFVVGSGTTNNPFNTSLSTSGLNVGDRLCVTLEISPWATANKPEYDASRPVYFSKPACALVTKSPQLNLRGTDSYSGARYWGDNSAQINKEGGFKSSKFADTTGNTNRGSWSQYGILATGSTLSDNTANNNNGATIQYFGSAGFTTTQGTNRDNSCKLAFSNISPSGGAGGSTCSGNAMINGDAGKFRNLDRTINLPSVAKATTKSSTTTITLDTDFPLGSSGTYRYDVSGGTLNISGNVLKGIKDTSTPKGNHLTIYVEGNVLINGNIVFQGPSYTNLSEIPSLTIYATDNIEIAPGVTQIDGTLVAGKAVHTCNTNRDSTFGPHLGLNNSPGGCNQQLTINGAIVSKDSPHFRRTFGGGTSTTITDIANTNAPRAPAEIVNYTPNLFLTPYYMDSNLDDSTIWDTVRQGGLPARY